VAQIPRYKDKNGFFKSVHVPWSEEYERITELLKKNDRNLAVDQKSDQNG
jgi:hypothetical protein